VFVLAYATTVPYPNSLFAIDVATGSVSGPVVLGTIGGNSLAVNNAGTKIYVNSYQNVDPYAARILEVDPATLSVLRTSPALSCAFPTSLAVNPADSAVFLGADSKIGSIEDRII
jgi:DNA-binding beta-propeller fold protein YncE